MKNSIPNFFGVLSGAIHLVIIYMFTRTTYTEILEYMRDNNNTRLIAKHFFFKAVLSLSSFSGVLYFYVLIKQDFPILSGSMINLGSDHFVMRNLFYLSFFGLFAYATLKLSYLIYSPVETLKIKEEKPIESVAVPTYIGLFVIALGLGQFELKIGYIVLLILFLFWRRLEKIFYFNPIWLFFGYRFYEVKSEKNNTYTLITKRSKLKGSYSLYNLRRLNDYTYLEGKK